MAYFQNSKNFDFSTHFLNKNLGPEAEPTFIKKGGVLLKSENISNIDIFCALTDDDETNLMSSLLAKKMGAKNLEDLKSLITKQVSNEYKNSLNII